MFLEIKLDDTIVVEPQFLDENLQQKIQELVKHKYIGKVVQGKGLCFKITKIQIAESRICNVSGNADFEVKLACLLFSSFKNEVLEGVIKSASKQGIVVDFLGIEVFIPELNLFRNTN
jgi:DNA-directed RNA polymerase subunit E'/Rpb7